MIFPSDRSVSVTPLGSVRAHASSGDCAKWRKVPVRSRRASRRFQACAPTLFGTGSLTVDFLDFQLQFQISRVSPIRTRAPRQSRNTQRKETEEGSRTTLWNIPNRSRRFAHHQDPFPGSQQDFARFPPILQNAEGSHASHTRYEHRTSMCPDVV